MMNQLAKFRANERRDELFAAADWRSVVSGEPLRSGVPQLAHRVARTRNHLDKYGTEVIDHDLNLVPVRNLTENDRCNIGNRPVEANELLQRIIRINTGREAMPSLREYYASLRREFMEGEK